MSARFSNKQVAVGYSLIALGHTNPKAVAVRVQHGIPVARGIEPVGNSALGNILLGRSGKRCNIGAEAVRVAAGGNCLTFFLVIVVRVQLVGAGLGEIGRASCRERVLSHV